MQVRILGPVDLQGGGGGSVAPRRRLARVLLGSLALRANTTVTADWLTDALWRGSPPPSAPANLRSYVAELRRLTGTGGPVVQAGPRGYRLTAAPDQLDALLFDRLRAEGRAELAAGRHGAAAQLLTRALGLWRGPVLDGLAVPDAVQPEVGRLDERRLSALEDCTAARLALGQYAELAGELPAVLAAYPLREQLWRQLMLALHHAGRPAEAIAAYQRLRGGLAGDLGVPPSAETEQLAGRIRSADPTLRPAAVPVAAPAMLPREVPGFSGRAGELARLDQLRPPAVVVLSGMAGVGKTALAVHWAHRSRGAFPDGQLYLNLRGFEPAGVALAPARAASTILEALGVPGERLPAGLDALVALYRGELAGRRVLIVLDNARDAEQVRPLLPGGPTALVVVTSRDRLTGLVATDGACPLPVDVLSRAGAYELLAYRLGAGRLTGEPAATEEIIVRCGRLPLALAVVAARAATHPAFPLAALAAELHPGHGLDALAGTDAPSDLRAVFATSYQALPPAAARLFRLLGLPTGPDLGAAAIASLAGLPGGQTRPLLAGLAQAHLVTEHRPGRYVLHDLLRSYAAELAGAGESGPAVHRLLDHYLHSSEAAALLLNPYRDRVSYQSTSDGVRAEQPADAQEWYASERRVLLAAVELAAATGTAARCWQLARNLVTYLDRQGHLADIVASQQLALGAAVAGGELIGQWYAHHFLSRAYTRLGRPADAEDELRQLLPLARALGERRHAHSLQNLAEWCTRQGRHAQALEHARHALELYRRLELPAGQAIMLNSIGWSCAQLGDYQAAVEHCEQAVALQQRLGAAADEAFSWDSLGYAQHRLGDFAAAARSYQRGIELSQAVRDRPVEAEILDHLGDAHAAAGDHEAAGQAWLRSATILDEIGDPGAERVRAKL